MNEKNLKTENHRKRRDLDMLHGSLWDKLLMFALPLAAGSMLQQLFNSADIAVIGRFVGKHAMAAVGSNGPIISLLVNFFVGLSIGANAIIAQSIGRNDRKRVTEAVHTSIVIAVLGGVITGSVGFIFVRPILELMAVPGSVAPLAAVYLRIYFAGMPFIMLYNFEASIFRSRGDTRTPLVVLILAGSMNVALNLVFVVGLHRSVDGVAIATVISNIFSSMTLLVLLVRDKTWIHVDIRRLRIYRSVMGQILKIGMPAGVQGIVFSISNTIVQAAVNSLGADIMAGSSAGYNLEIFEYFMLNAFGQAAVTFIGQNYGAGDLDRCRRVTRDVMTEIMILTVIVSFLMVHFSAGLLGIFSKDPAVIRYGQVRVRAILTIYILDAFIEVMSGIMRGYGYSIIPAAISVIGICGVRISWVFLVFPHFRTLGNLLSVYPISWAVTSAVLVIAYFRMMGHLRRSHSLRRETCAACEVSVKAD